MGTPDSTLAFLQNHQMGRAVGGGDQDEEHM